MSDPADERDAAPRIDPDIEEVVSSIQRLISADEMRWADRRARRDAEAGGQDNGRLVLTPSHRVEREAAREPPLRLGSVARSAAGGDAEAAPGPATGTDFLVLPQAARVDPPAPPASPPVSGEETDDGESEASVEVFEADTLARRPYYDALQDASREGGAAENAGLDEDRLRALVAEIVRQELQGALGERITRNVRKLVRREIMRTLSARDDG